MAVKTPSARLLSEKDAARYIGMSDSFLRQSRCHGNLPGRAPAPDFIRIGRTIRYDIEELDAWIDRHRTQCR